MSVIKENNDACHWQQALIVLSLNKGHYEKDCNHWYIA
jgi:hypothetical protein